MRRISFNIIMVGVLALSLLASCKKDKTNGKMVFKAELQQPNEGMKTSIQPDGTVLWSAGDAIEVYNGTDHATFTTAEGNVTTATFTGDIDEADTYYAAYPASAASFATSGGSKTVTFTLPATQSVGTTAGDFDKDVALMVSASDKQSFEFKNVFGILALSMKSANDISHVSSFTLTAKGGVKIWGSSCSVTLNDDNTFTWNGLEGGTSSITLTCDVDLTDAAQTFYILIPPVAMTGGLELKIYNGATEIYSLETTSSVTIGSNAGVTFQHDNGSGPEPLVIEPTVPGPAAWDGDLSKLTDESTEEFATATNGMTITGTLGANVKVSIADGATVTLDNVTINGEMDFNYRWAGISCLGDATIILKDGTTNTVKGFFHIYPGIHIATGHTLTIQGTGSLDASSNGNGAGIGGGAASLSCGNISIENGIITATGGGDCAGIGGGAGNGMTAASCGDITISGGTVTAVNNGGSFGAGPGIGSGRRGSCGDITITDGAIVTATKGNYALDCIGRGQDGTCGTVKIGGTMYYQNNAYVGDGATYLTQSTLVYPTPTPIEQIVDLSTITSAYTAVDGDILTGTLGTGVQISIADGATITLRSANINGSDNLSGTFHGLKCVGDATIILENNDNVVKAKCGEDDGKAGIFVPRDKTLTIQAGNSSGKIEATGAGEAAGIGGCYGTHCGAIVINSGKVNATAGSNAYFYGYGAGIGACGYSRCDGITITGGQTIARAYGYAAGIGTGGDDISTGYCNPGDQAAITINISSGDGWVKAYKGSDATYFIGGGGSLHCGYVTVGGVTYEDNGNRGITSSTPGNIDLSVGEDVVSYIP